MQVAIPENGQTFEAYLLETARIPPQHVPYYARWVERFRQLSAASVARQRALKELRSQLSRNCEQWQVDQACEAVRHYWFWVDRCGSAQTRPPDTDDGWLELIEEVRRLLRLQHKSYRTEQTYLGWVRRFLAFVGQVERSVIDQTHLRHYLTFLAVERRVSSATQQEAGYDIRTVQELLGHSHVETTMIYTHVARRHKTGVISPLERLGHSPALEGAEPGSSPLRLLAAPTPGFSG